MKQFVISTIFVTTIFYLVDVLFSANHSFMKSFTLGIFLSLVFHYINRLSAKKNLKTWGYDNIFPEALQTHQKIELSNSISVEELVQKIIHDPFINIKEKNLKDQYLLVSLNLPNSSGTSKEKIQWENAGDGNLKITLSSEPKFSWRKFDAMAYHFGRVKYLEKIFK